MWALTSKQLKKFRITQNSMLKNLLKVRLGDKMSIATIYGKTKAKKIRGAAKAVKYRYAAHIVRDNTAKWNYILTMQISHWGKWGRTKHQMERQN